jgi:hypothetical protein
MLYMAGMVVVGRDASHLGVIRADSLDEARGWVIRMALDNWGDAEGVKVSIAPLTEPDGNGWFPKGADDNLYIDLDAARSDRSEAAQDAAAPAGSTGNDNDDAEARVSRGGQASHWMGELLRRLRRQ